MKLRNVPPITVEKFKVESRSSPGHYWTVELLSDGTLICNCDAGWYNKPCWHKKKIRKMLRLKKDTN